MRITRIDIEGERGRYATIGRKKGSNTIDITILTPSQPQGQVHRIDARSDDKELWRQARNLHQALMGYDGTNGDIYEYYRQLQEFAD